LLRRRCSANDECVQAPYEEEKKKEEKKKDTHGKNGQFSGLNYT
jgi:hypothetical protein